MVKKYWLLLLLPFVGAFDMVAQQGQFVIQGGASVRVSGAPTIRLQKTDWQNNGSASMATSTLVLSGDAASAVISGAASDVFQHLKIATPSGQVALGKNISVQGDLTFESGLLQLDGRNITLDPAGKLENESETSRITSNANGGEISISLSLNAPAAANPGNLGAVITSASDLGTVIVSRGHLAQSGACNAGMNRWLDIQAAQNAGLNATLRLRYFDAELDGISESELTIFRSDDGGATWTDIGFSARNATENWVEQTGLNSLSRFTLGSANQWLSPKTWYEDEDGDTFGNAAVTEMACAPSSNFISNDDDCDDADAARFPGNPEICDGKDNDCDLELPANEADSDGDDFMVCENDCDDTNTAIHPAASETCNGLDDDCDDLVDQADPGLVDNDPPTAACKPAHLTLRPDGTASLAAATVNDGSTDNCTAAGDLVLAVWPNTFGCADAGTAMATLTVADGMGNTATCAATVTVLDVLYHSQEVQRMAADGLAGDNLGWGIALDGPTAIAGAPYDKVGTQSKQGSAYVFLQNQGGTDNWGQLKQIKASDGAAVDYFGNAISMDGGLALVAAHGDNVGATADAGSVYVFEQNLPTGNNWGQQANIIARNGAASDAAAYDYFGNAVSLQNGRAVVGAAKKKVGTNNAQGAAYIYEQNADGPNAWGNVKKLTAPDGAANNFFGQSVAQSGNLVLVGANGHLGNRGAAYLFDGGAAWAQVQKLMASDAAVGDGFGTSVSMSNSCAVIGAPNKAGYTGAAYVFKNDAGTWSQAKKLVASDGAANDRFGTAVALSGDYAYVTAVRGNANAGAVYVFHKDAGGVGNWGQIGRYTAADGANGDQFGYALGVSGERMALGANLDDVAAKADQGSVYVFKGEGCPGAPKPEGIVSPQSRGLAVSSAVQCSPNPFRDELTVEIAQSGISNLASEIVVMDAVGRVAMRVELPAGQSRHTLRTDELRAGTYFVQISSEAGVQVVPVVLVR